MTHPSTLITADGVWEDVAAIRDRGPLIHNITNYVVMNSTANALLAVGASPVMAHAIDEVADMVALAGALVINIGTLSPAWVEAMHIAMREAQERGTPIVLDPVGAGATRYRTSTADALMADVTPTIIRGNASEIMAVAAAGATTKGVDSSESAASAVGAAERLADRTGAAVVVTGATDLVISTRGTLALDNGHPLMARVTGLGCTATALCGAFAAVQPDPARAAAHATAVTGIVGELAAERAEGPGSLQMHLLDHLHTLTAAQIAERLRVHDAVASDA